MSEGRLFILSAPSGAGKTTILKQVMVDLPALIFSVSHTTRPPRKGETDGVDYHFINRADFNRMSDNGDFLESAEVHGNMYGTSLQAVTNQLESGLDVILDIDVQGAAQISGNGKGIKPVTVFILPPSMAELEKRLSGRDTDTKETIKLRLENAVKEMAGADSYDHVIINDKLAEAVEMVEAVILAERSRARRDRSGATVTWFPVNS